MTGRCINSPPSDSGGSAGAYMDFSARPSVKVNPCEFFTPVIATYQENPRSGFPAGQLRAVIDVSSTHSGKCSTLKASPTLERNRSQLCAAVSLCGASLAQSTLLSSIPHLAASSGAALFRGDA
jgi:hypothetical protein